MESEGDRERNEEFVTDETRDTHDPSESPQAPWYIVVEDPGLVYRALVARGHTRRVPWDLPRN